MPTKRKRRHPIGTRVMWAYGRKDYATYGEIGTVTAHDENTKYGLIVTTDDHQPFHRAVFGAKSKPTGNSRVVRVTSEEVPKLAEVYRENARRLRRVAKTWDDAARRVDAEGVSS